MSSSHGRKSLTSRWLSSTEEIVRKFHVTEKTKSICQIQLLIGLAAINEEVQRENGFGISSEVARCDEGKVWVGGY